MHLGKLKLYTQKLDKGYRMLRAGFGQHKSRWFLRFDLWWFMVRLTKRYE